MQFRIVGSIEGVELIAIGRSIRKLGWLRKKYGGWRWRKLKGTAFVELADGTIVRAEIHWHEAHGIGCRDAKIKRLLE